MSLLPPTWLNYEGLNKKIVWESIPEADSYELSVKPKLSTTWTTVVVSNNEYPYNNIPGEYEATVKTGKGGEWGPQSRLFEFTI